MKMFTEEQQRIYDGLKNIGESLSNFYLDGVRMISPDCTILSKANMIAHAAREIDGGLRDVFAPDIITKKKIALIPGAKPDMKHFPSILAAIGKDDPNNALATKWFDIACNFHRIAHRKDIHAGSTDATQIIGLWGEYEKVLSVVIGSFLSITNRLDVLLTLDEPQQDALPAIKNILRNPKHAHYFFSRLDKVRWLRTLISEGYFDSGNAPVTIEGNAMPDQWLVIKYLVNISAVARRNVKVDLIAVIDHIMTNFIDGAIQLHPYTVLEILQIIINVDDLSFTAKIKQFFEKDDAQNSRQGWSMTNSVMVEGLADKVIKKEDTDGLKNLLDYFFGFTTYEEPAISFFGEEAKPYLQKKPNVEDHFINELLVKHGKEVMQLLGADAIRIAMKKLTDIVKLGSFSLSGGSPASIEPTNQSTYSFGWETVLVYFIRDYAPQLEHGSLDTIIDELLDSKIQILERLAIHLIRTHYTEFSDKWWDFIENNTNDETVYIHEPYVLLKEYSKTFTDEEFEKVVNWIEKMNPGDIGEDKDLAKRFAGYRIRRWLTSLEPQTVKTIALKTEKEIFYLQWNSSQMIDHPEFDSYGTSSIGFDHPMEFSAFKALGVQEQIEYIQKFEPDQMHISSEQGLGELLEGNVIVDPEKYLYALDDFMPLHSLYINDLVNGFTEALKKDKIADYSLPLGFVEAKLVDKSFSSEEEKGFQFKKWLASSISEYIQTIAAKSEQLNIGKPDLERMITLLLSMIETKEFQDDTEEIRNGYINHILNSVPGRIYLALMQLVRIWADTVAEKDNPVKWPESVKEHFTKLLSSSANKDKDYSIILGMELALIAYLDRKWVEDNITTILDEKNTAHFEYRLYSIFSRYYTISFNYYKLLKEFNVFSTALRHFELESGSLDTVMIFALFEWKFWKGDPESGSILAEILSLKKPEQIKRLVREAWEQKVLSQDELIYLVEKLMPVFEEQPELTPHCSILLWLFERMLGLSPKAFELATTIISKTTEGREIYSFLRHLYSICDTNLEGTGKLVLQAYTAKLATPFLEHDLKAFVEKLYKAGFKDIADGISVQAGEMGSLALKDLYNENN